MHCTCKTLLGSVFSAAQTTRATSLPPPFLLPAFATAQTSSFSTTSSRDARKDGNPGRGVSALHRTGLRKRARGLSVDRTKLPKPVLDRSKLTQVEVDEDHGLWDFFPPNRSSMLTPGELAAHGVGWSINQLRSKDWDDLHRLWWVCLKEMNRLHTYKAERSRVKDLYGEYESEGRRDEVSFVTRHM
ncbi:hypothetical protein BT93_L1006 [Corymbia citriodora subsp. variegata]|uniref:Large ribosomal subunit protein uL29m n=1 Tax=Corymbia citriodora subsp. variegata TaxID=360336 RepID=A0A8T0CIQ1_CORYI|nr:hypothetical protein BT93_L1006 [Corymbia citriodora subsp. variegata]